ncbi:glycosyltransferase family 2 protein [Pontibacter beigongshangensis]|uniref:glycosyltransferase family 2 protein n=1 Tax=Pontibacter beigongshangensis TaxID=2574733 RepID=UPI001650AF47|nr:glycosyltransferase family 2 protein [Pontibacter beigongshangensis]
MGATCLIPVYNERDRIAQVLEVVTKVKNIDQVMCVDDGSTDGTGDFIRQYWPAVQVVVLPYNQGKAAAIDHGLRWVKNEAVLLMDADLRGLNATELEKAVAAFLDFRTVDMLILRRMNSPWFVKFYRSDILLSGERLVRKKDLEQVLSGQVQRYQLEVAINNYMLRHHKQVRWLPCSALNTYKVKKWGRLDGSYKELKMYADIVAYVGLLNMVLQLTSFATKRLDTGGNTGAASKTYRAILG